MVQGTGKQSAKITNSATGLQEENSRLKLQGLHRALEHLQPETVVTLASLLRGEAGKGLSRLLSGLWQMGTQSIGPDQPRPWASAEEMRPTAAKSMALSRGLDEWAAFLTPRTR